MNRMNARKNWIAAILVGLTLVVFWPVTRHDFVNFDDYDYVSENRFIKNGLTAEGLTWAFTSVGHLSNWHPLTWISHMTDIQFFGTNPGRHHLVSLLLHLLNVLLLFVVLFELTGALWRSTLVSAVFAIHPLHVESVAWLSERKDVLSALFFF